MSEELNIGDYVRTKGGNIFKIIGGNLDDWEIDISCTQLEQTEENWCESNRYNDNGYWFTNENIIKSSPNIIDLIEVGDLVKIENEGWVQVSIKFETLKFFDNSGTEYLYEEIEAIITKEQIASMEYKVGGKE